MNVGSLSGRSGEVVDVFERRRVDIRFLQVRYGGKRTRVHGDEEKYKFWRSGSAEGRNEVGIVVKEDLVEEVIEVKRLDDRMLKITCHVIDRKFGCEVFLIENIDEDMRQLTNYCMLTVFISPRSL